MSSLYKRKNSPYWYALFEIGRERHRFSTGETSKAKAEDVLRHKMDEARGRVTVDELADQLQNAIDALPQRERDVVRCRIVRNLARAQDQKLSISELWKAWLASPRRGNIAESTMAVYVGIWKRFEAWMKAHRSRLLYLHEVDAATAEAYASDLWGSRVSHRTYNAHLNHLGGMTEALTIRAGITSTSGESCRRWRARQRAGVRSCLLNSKT